MKPHSHAVFTSVFHSPSRVVHVRTQYSLSVSPSFSIYLSLNLSLVLVLAFKKETFTLERSSAHDTAHLDEADIHERAGLVDGRVSCRRRNDLRRRHSSLRAKRGGSIGCRNSSCDGQMN